MEGGADNVELVDLNARYPAGLPDAAVKEPLSPAVVTFVKVRFVGWDTDVVASVDWLAGLPGAVLVR